MRDDMDVRVVRKRLNDIATTLLKLVTTSRRAVCASKNTAQFFTEGALLLSQLAYLVCGPCPVHQACLWGESSHEVATGAPRFGLWGQIPEERARLCETTTLDEFLDVLDDIVARPIEVDDDVDPIYHPTMFGTPSLVDRDMERLRLLLADHAEQLRNMLLRDPTWGTVTLEELRPAHAQRTTIEMGRKRS